MELLRQALRLPDVRRRRLAALGDQPGSRAERRSRRPGRRPAGRRSPPGCWAPRRARARNRRRLGQSVAIAALLAATRGADRHCRRAAERVDRRWPNRAPSPSRRSASPPCAPRAAGVRRLDRGLVRHLPGQRARRALHAGSRSRPSPQHHVAYLGGDWTRQDPAITGFLAGTAATACRSTSISRPGREPAIVLPQILTEKLVLARLEGGASK